MDVKCHNPSRACTSTSYSAPKTASRGFPTKFAPHCMPTWELCWRTVHARPRLSIQSPTMCTSFLTLPERLHLAMSWRMLKNTRQNGLRRKAGNLRRLRGRADMARFPFRKAWWTKFGNISTTNRTTTASRRFKRSSEGFWYATAFRMMNDMCGIEPSKLSRPFRAHGSCYNALPRALPWAGMSRPVGAGDMLCHPIGYEFDRSNWERNEHIVANAATCHEGPAFAEMRFTAPKGRFIPAQGNALGKGSVWGQKGGMINAIS